MNSTPERLAILDTEMDNVTVMTLPTTDDVNKQNAKVPTLEESNSSEVERLIPTIVFLLIISVVGMIGNCLVIHVYRTRYKTSNSKSFILCLSVVDFLTCCVAIPLEISTVLNQYTFEHLWLCKLARVFNTLGTMSSSFILLFIAIDRFRKVCKPFGWQIETKVAKNLCGLAILLGILVSWPAVLIYGKKTYDIPQYNMTGTECSTADDTVNTKFPFLYYLVFGIMFVTGIIAMSILYCFIGYKVRRHSRKMSEMLRRNMSIPVTLLIIDQRHSNGDVGGIECNVLAEYDLAKYKNEELRKKTKNEDKIKNDSEDSWSDKKEFELSYNLSQEAKEKDTRHDSKTDGNHPKERVDENHSDSEDSGIKLKEETEQTDKNTNNDKSVSGRYQKNHKTSVQDLQMDEFKHSVSPTSSEEIFTKQNRMLRRISSMSSRISNAIVRMTSVTSARTSSEVNTLKCTQFLKESRARKTAFLMFVITMAFILNFLPHLVLMLIRQIRKSFVDNLSDTSRAVYKFFLRSYFLNSAINPLIYSICDSRFKSACKEIFIQKYVQTSRLAKTQDIRYYRRHTNVL